MTKVHLYNDYIRKVSRVFEEKFAGIEIGENFDYGDEFEIALCEVLSMCLPERFGVKRGYVVSTSGEKAGDDIIIYDKARFPLLSLRNQKEFGRNEFIPIEAAYCYIEAKHTIHLEGNDPQSLRHALQQVAKVKRLVATRQPVPLNTIRHNLTVGEGLNVTPRENYPNIFNPFLGGIFARQVKLKKEGEIVRDPAQIHKAILSVRKVDNTLPCDLSILGSSNTIIPLVYKPNADPLFTPFLVDNVSTAAAKPVIDCAFGIGLCAILSALEYIELGSMPWQEIIADGFNK